jgi:polyisoprenoid-binding protein YceI
MFQRVLAVGAVVVVLAIAIVGYMVFRTPEAASGPITAIPIAATTAPAAQATSAATSAPEAEAAASAPAAESAATSAPEAETAASGQIFEIVAGQSEARFLIDEVLRGAPTTVVGATDQVAGQIAIDPSNPQGVQVGTIQINARTLATDNDFRNRAIKNAILQTDSYEFVTFAPTAISGLPETVTVGQPFTFQMTGDLTVTDATQSVTFDVTVTPTSESAITGTATTTVLYSDFGLNIPDSPQVDTVADQVRLELDFIAQTAA